MAFYLLGGGCTSMQTSTECHKLLDQTNSMTIPPANVGPVSMELLWHRICRFRPTYQKRRLKENISWIHHGVPHDCWASWSGR